MSNTKFIYIYYIKPIIYVILNFPFLLIFFVYLIQH